MLHRRLRMSAIILKASAPPVMLARASDGGNPRGLHAIPAGALQEGLPRRCTDVHTCKARAGWHLERNEKKNNLPHVEVEQSRPGCQQKRIKYVLAMRHSWNHSEKTESRRPHAALNRPFPAYLFALSFGAAATPLWRAFKRAANFRDRGALLLAAPAAN